MPQKFLRSEFLRLKYVLSNRKAFLFLNLYATLCYIFFSFCVSCPQKKSSKGKEKKLKRKEVSSEIFLCKSNLIIRIHFKPSLTCDRETHQGHS